MHFGKRWLHSFRKDNEYQEKNMLESLDEEESPLIQELPLEELSLSFVLVFSGKLFQKNNSGALAPFIGTFSSGKSMESFQISGSNE